MEMGGAPGHFVTPMNHPHPNSVSYTTSPHALGSAQWAPPNANLFPQNSGLPNHIGPPHPPGGMPPNATFSDPHAGGARFRTTVPGGDQRSQGSNLSAAAAAAAAVMAAATATAHATATLTLKPGVQSQGFPPDNGGPPPSMHPQQQQQAQSVIHQQTPPHQVRLCVQFCVPCKLRLVSVFCAS